MKAILVLAIFASVPSVHAALLAECKGPKIKISVTSGKNDHEANVTLNGAQMVVDRKMEDGAVTYSNKPFEFTVMGNHREMGNPIGYLQLSEKQHRVVCSYGVDMAKILDDTDL